jgi:exonuclease SbcD
VRKITGTLAEVTASPSDDFVSVTLTDKNDLDVFDMHDRLKAAFPNLLDIRREQPLRPREQADITTADTLTPFELCKAFLGTITPEEEDLLTDLINTVQEQH